MYAIRVFSAEAKTWVCTGDYIRVPPDTDDTGIVNWQHARVQDHVKSRGWEPTKVQFVWSTREPTEVASVWDYDRAWDIPWNKEPLYMCLQCGQSIRGVKAMVMQGPQGEEGPGCSRCLGSVVKKMSDEKFARDY
jgi:hypothetical protein